MKSLFALTIIFFANSCGVQEDPKVETVEISNQPDAIIEEPPKIEAPVIKPIPLPSAKSSEKTGKPTLPPSVEEYSPEELAEMINDLPPTAAGESDKKTFDNYKVELAVDSAIEINSTAAMNIWIGPSTLEKEKIEGTVTNSSLIPSNEGDWAKITPIAPDFEILGFEGGKCYKISQSGSEVTFDLKPKTKGNFKVRAEIELYKGDNCSGTPVPKVSRILKVEVKVNKGKIVKKKINELGDAAWNQFLTLWGSILTLISGLVIFLIRKFLKKKTGYSGPKED